uniref:Helicase C-terminal domain-containing protein n=1 Tax=Eutreptiella gymnastica TaxID=73025 RepID=A0A7S4G5J2_9EUGL
MDTLAEVVADSDPACPNKVLIFSQWTRMLDLMQAPLAAASHEYARIDGTMSVARRQQELTRFADSGTCNILLMSLKAGGVGLNITAANVVFLMDLWWNPAVEDQAVARAHRMSQLRDVHVHRFIIQDTIEQRILAIHDRKRRAADTALAGGAVAATMSEAEIVEVFLG